MDFDVLQGMVGLCIDGHVHGCPHIDESVYTKRLLSCSGSLLCIDIVIVVILLSSKHSS